MEFTILGILAVGTVVISLGVLIPSIFLIGMWYGKRYWSGEECDFKGRYLQSSWRRDLYTGHEPLFWRCVKYLTKFVFDPKQVEYLKDQKDPVLYICQPHGIFALSAVLTFMSGAMDRPRRRVLVVIHGWYWWVPFVRDIMLALGCIDRHWTSIQNALANGYSVAIMPGAVIEMGPPLIPLPLVFPIVSRIHQAGLPFIVPVYFEGEKEICWVWHNEPDFMKQFRRFAYKLIGWHGFLPFCPRLWNWPVLKPRFGHVLNPRDYTPLVMTIALGTGETKVQKTGEEVFQEAYEKEQESMGNKIHVVITKIPGTGLVEARKDVDQYYENDQYYEKSGVFCTL
jgi:hypothetical protein